MQGRNTIGARCLACRCRPAPAARARHRPRCPLPGTVSALLLLLTIGCGGHAKAPTRPVIRIIGSDTMVNLLQAWAERYSRIMPGVVVQVAGGGSGVGVAGLIDRTLDIAAASRELRSSERDRLVRVYGAGPTERTVALDALAIYVHRRNPVRRIALADLADIYGEHGHLLHWSQLGLRLPGCPSDTIVRVGRQNNSGTYAYFRQRVLGPGREYKLGSIDQSGSKDVVALVGQTPCAIGYSGLAYATGDVTALQVSAERHGVAIAASTASVLDGSYPLARPLYLYAPTSPAEHVLAFLRWVSSSDGQAIVSELGFVPVPSPPPAAANAAGNR